MNGLLSKIRSPWRIQRLKRQYLHLSFQSKTQAEKSLQRQLRTLKTKYPGYSEEWYLEKVIYDLQRDRR